MPFFTSFNDTFRPLRRIAASSCGRPFILITATQSRFGIALLFCLFWILSTVNSVSASPEASNSPGDFLDMPPEYGEVIYRINAQSPKQLYIIGISHKDPDTGANNSTTVQTQMEIFRIGEWLKKNMSLNLLLPEGYFTDRQAIAAPLTAPIIAHKASAFQSVDTFNPIHLDNLLIQEKLAAVTPYVNAEMLLMEYHSFRASQVEDKNMYDAVRSSLCKLKTTGTEPSRSAGNIAELLYLQEVRTAQILQNIPGVIEGEFLTGAIGNRSALFTIGLNHIKDIFRYIQNDEISISSPAGSDVRPDFLCSRLNLLETGYGVTIIIPRTLANNRKLLEMTNIDRILVADGKLSERAR